MKRTIEELNIRINKLEKKDPVGNKNIINKIKRRVEAMKK